MIFIFLKVRILKLVKATLINRLSYGIHCNDFDLLNSYAIAYIDAFFDSRNHIFFAQENVQS